MWEEDPESFGNDTSPDTSAESKCPDLSEPAHCWTEIPGSTCREVSILTLGVSLTRMDCLYKDVLMSYGSAVFMQ